MADFIPSSENELMSWGKNYCSTIVTAGPALAQSPEETSAVQNAYQVAEASKIKSDELEAAARMAKAEKKAAIEVFKDHARSMTNRMKANGNWSAAYSSALQTDYVPVVVDLVNYKPIAKLSVIAGKVHVSFTKNGVDGMNVYTKTDQEKDFGKPVFTKKNPFIDPNVLKQTGVAELRYYILVAVKGNKEIGQPSDVASIGYGG